MLPPPLPEEDTEPPFELVEFLERRPWTIEEIHEVNLCSFWIRWTNWTKFQVLEAWWWVARAWTVLPCAPSPATARRELRI